VQYLLQKHTETGCRAISRLLPVKLITVRATEIGTLTEQFEELQDEVEPVFPPCDDTIS
jgi:hypothetical protein